MKVLGGDQFSKKKFKLLGLPDGKIKDLMGDLPRGFVGIVFGEPGQGKTELCLQIAAALTDFGRVAWFSYEQGLTSYSLQKAVVRNGLEKKSGKFLVVDPRVKDENDTRPVNDIHFENICNFLSRRRSPQFVFIDSIDYTRLTLDQFYEIKKRFEQTHGIIFISHCKNGQPESRVGKKINHDGEFGIFVNKFIAYSKKSRNGGDNYIIYEEKARTLNPVYFAKLEGGDVVPVKRGKGRPRKNK